jgi:hypothetical protein
MAVALTPALSQREKGDLRSELRATFMVSAAGACVHAKHRRPVAPEQEPASETAGAESGTTDRQKRNGMDALTV